MWLSRGSLQTRQRSRQKNDAPYLPQLGLPETHMLVHNTAQSCEAILKGHFIANMDLISSLLG